MIHALPDGFILIADNAGDLRISRKMTQHHGPVHHVANGGGEAFPVYIECRDDRIRVRRAQLFREFIQISAQQKFHFPAIILEQLLREAKDRAVSTIVHW